MAVFSQEKTVCLLSTQRDRQMAVSSNSLSVSGMFNSPQSRRMAVFLLGKQFVDSPGTSRRMAVFTPKTVRPPSNKVISPSKRARAHMTIFQRRQVKREDGEVSLLPSNGVSSPSADEKFDEETNL